MALILLLGLLPCWNYVNIGITPVLDKVYFWIFLDILRIFLDYLQIILYFLYVCQSVCQSLISLPTGHLWGSTSETSGLVFLQSNGNITITSNPKSKLIYFFSIAVYKYSVSD